MLLSPEQRCVFALQKSAQEEEEEYGVDPDMALAMGFTGFGGSR